MAKKVKNPVSIGYTACQRGIIGVNQRWTIGSGLLYAILLTLRESL